MSTPIADANRVRLAFVAESAWGSTPTASAFQELRITGESLAHSKETVVSDEIRSDRMRADILEVAANASGDFSFEFSFAAYDDFIQAVLQGTYVTVSTAQANCVFTSTSINVVATTIADGLSVGQWFRVSNAGSNSGIFRVASKAGSVITVDGATFAAATTIASSVTIRGRTVTNGTTQRSFSLERQHLDVLQYALFRGMRVDSMSLDVSSGAIITGSFSFMGRDGAYASTSVASAVTAATTNDVVTATANVGRIYEGNNFAATLATALQSISLSISNNMRMQQAVANRTPVGIGTGSIDVSGSLTAYFDNADLVRKFVNHVASGLSFRIADAAGNAVVFTLPKLYFTEGNAPAGGINTDVTVNLSFQATRDPVSGIVIRADLLAA